MGMGRPGPDLGPGPVALRPILELMGRPISPRCYGLDSLLGRTVNMSVRYNRKKYQIFKNQGPK